MGVVVRARHIELERSVAIKLIRSELVATDALLDRFFQEARAAARLTSEHACRVWDIGRVASGAPFLVMDLLEGQDLKQVLRERGQVPVEQACSWIAQACEAMAEAHARGIVHRDLKPDNLFLASTPLGPTLKVLDFGVCRLLDGDSRSWRPGLTESNALVGSPRYMSPEQIRGSRANARSDQWALGMLLYELIGGRPAFRGEALPALLAAVERDEPAPLSTLVSDLPPDLDGAVLRCLRKRPEERFEDVAELARAIAPHAVPAGRSCAQRARDYLDNLPAPNLAPPTSHEPPSAKEPPTSKFWETRPAPPTRSAADATPEVEPAPAPAPSAARSARLSSFSNRYALGAVALVALNVGAVAWLLSDRQQPPPHAPTVNTTVQRSLPERGMGQAPSQPARATPAPAESARPAADVEAAPPPGDVAAAAGSATALPAEAAPSAAAKGPHGSAPPRDETVSKRPLAPAPAATSPAPRGDERASEALLAGGSAPVGSGPSVAPVPGPATGGSGGDDAPTVATGSHDTGASSAARRKEVFRPRDAFDPRYFGGRL